MDVPIHSIRYFCVLAEELHFGKAAERLRITPPSLSQQISKLESQLGVPLFDRSPRKVSMTPQGLDLLPLARRVRDDHDQILAWARSVRGARETPGIRVGMVASGTAGLSTAIISSVLHRAPDARIEMRRLGFFDVESALTSGQVDVVLAPWPMKLPPRIRVEALWEEPRVLIVPDTHPLASREVISIMETADEVFLTAAGGDPDIVNWWVVDPRPDGSRPQRGPTADSVQGLLDLVAAGAGVNIGGEGGVLNYLRDGIAYVPLADVSPAMIVLCTLTDATNPMVPVFRETARSISPLVDTDLPPLGES
ncbi:LysR family transcriptional regulator [Microbacterium sp. NPDC077184]|uniref:LysR family transcriptional regulator n=1 Tax=Microbacterium sp. NPDC077184 TaxID=3154764 RepID=UPI00344466CE